MMPKRLQRKRTKGWRMPPNTVYVGRPTQWGNPWAATHHDRAHHPDVPVVEPAATPTEAVEKFRVYAETTLAHSPALAKLRGKDFACWCPLGSPCHADVLLELANA